MDDSFIDVKVSEGGAELHKDAPDDRLLYPVPLL